MSTSGRYALRATGHRERAVDELARRLPRVGLDGVLADLDRRATACAVPGAAAGDGLAWEPRDRDDRSWWPQGVACVRDADVLLASWYAKRRWLVRTQGSRISVVDRTDREQPRYRHVLLVVPRRRLGRPTMTSVRVHAGGIAVLGELLYVADTFAGVRVFRLADVLRVPPGRRTAYGYDHVLPQLLRLRVPLRPGRALRFSFLSVGRVDGQLSLVVGEYRRASSSPRLARYLLDPATGLPAFDDDGSCRPVELHDGQPPRMQGVAVHGRTWYVSASTGEARPGDLHVGAPGRFTRYPGVLPGSPEDLDWSRPGEQLWGATEWPGQRWLFPIDVDPWHVRAGPPAGAARRSASSGGSAGRTPA
jgi:hypothetical protein